MLKRNLIKIIKKCNGTIFNLYRFYKKSLCFILYKCYMSFRSKQPFRVFEFLKVFNSRLNPHDENSKIKSKKNADFKRMLIGRTNGLHRMCVFGLKYCMLSKKTIHILEVCQYYYIVKFYYDYAFTNAQNRRLSTILLHL